MTPASRGFGIYVGPETRLGKAFVVKPGDGWFVHSRSLRVVRMKYSIACVLPNWLRWLVADREPTLGANERLRLSRQLQCRPVRFAFEVPAHRVLNRQRDPRTDPRQQHEEKQACRIMLLAQSERLAAQPKQ